MFKLPLLPKLGVTLSLLGTMWSQAQVPTNPAPLVDQPALTFTTDAPLFFHEATVAESHDGSDALLFNGSVASSTFLETSIPGPAVVSWWWRRTATPATANPDMELWFIYDGNRLADHDDKQTWEKISIQIPAGPHTFRWQVPPHANSGEKAVLDELTIVPDVGLPEAAALNDPTGVWLRTELGTDWKVTMTTNHDGVSAAEARPTLKTQGTSLRRMVSGPAQISWWWQLQGADGNELKAKLRQIGPDDTTLVSRWDLKTPTAWQQASFAVPGGLHVVNWRYEYGTIDAMPPAVGAAGQVDEFSSSPIGIQEALGLPNQVWRFHSPWVVDAGSADVETPGSAGIASLGIAGGATDKGWIEGAFTGPALLSWWERTRSGTSRIIAAEVSMDGAVVPPSAIANADSGFVPTSWTRKMVLLPAGLHEIRWSYRNTLPEVFLEPVQFDRPRLMLALGADAKAAVGLPGAAAYAGAGDLTSVVTNAPGGPEGGTALRISSPTAPVFVFGLGNAPASPALVSYHYREISPPTSFLREYPANQVLGAGTTWSQRRVLLAGPTFLTWSQAAGATVELDRLEADAPVVDPAAWLARSGLNWTVEPGGIVLARTWDVILPSPTGDRLLVANGSSLRTSAQGPGLLQIELAQGSNFGVDFYVTADDAAVQQVTTPKDQNILRSFAIPSGAGVLNLLANSNLNMVAMTWTPNAQGAIANYLRTGFGGENMEFTLTAGNGADVVDDPLGFATERRVVRINGGFPSSELTTTLTGPGVLSFEWAEINGQNGNSTGWHLQAQPLALRAQSARSWSKVQVPVPPGTTTFKWVNSGQMPCYLENLKWEPSTSSAEPFTDLLASSSRQGGHFWAQQDGAERVMVAPFYRLLDPEVYLSVPSSGMLVAEARLLSSHSLPQFSYQDGYGHGVIRNSTSITTIDPSEQWRPVVLPASVADGLFQLRVGSAFGYEGDATNSTMPTTLVLRSASIQPVKTFAQMNLPGVTWEQEFSSAAVGTVGETAKGSARLWHLPQLAAPDQAKLSALVQGPGTLEWEASHSQMRVTLDIQATPGAMGAAETLLTAGPESSILPSHQLALPPGIHRVQWMYERGGFFNGNGGGLGLAVRWIPSSKPVLQAAVGLSSAFFTYFQSDGGWIPQRFSFTDPRIRLRTRFPGTGSIQLGGTGFPYSSPIWGTEQNWGDVMAQDRIVALSMAYQNLLTWDGPPGERGTLMEPFPVLQVGNITSQAAYAGETIGLWANRQQVGPNPNDDPDRDGLSWLVESAIGLNPHYPEPEAYEIQPGTPPKARFPWPLIIPEGITRVVEVSPNLTNWTPVAPVVKDGIAVVELQAPNKYVRVRVVQH